MANILGFGKKEIQLTEREEYIFKIVSGMLAKDNSDVKINPDTMEYFIHNDEHHLDIIIGGSYIAITNTHTLVKEDFRSDFIDHCKTAAKIRASRDREILKASILKREKNMYETIISALGNGEVKKA